VPSVPATAEVDDAAEGHKAFDRQDWATAATHYRLAIQKSPATLILHYRLAIAASWLDRRDEAMTEFEWVVANATAASEEARVARDWLAGARNRSVARADATPSQSSAKDDWAGDSGVHGRVVWNEGQGAEPLKRYQIHLYALGDDGKSKGISFRVRTDRDGNYRFAKVPPGTYKMTDNNVGEPKWRLKVELKQGEDAVIDLGPDNSVRTRDDFPKST
jgi:Carboxypeptidase regulatory-like domain